MTGPEAVDSARAVAPYCDAVLLDSRTADRLGGTGQAHDWSVSATIVRAMAECGRPVVLAGGLTPGTVAAIRRVHPYAVDVNSGVETLDGDKDPAACAAFVAAARSTPRRTPPRTSPCHRLGPVVQGDKVTTSLR
ncbi:MULTISPECIES: phosphoribosylanthranilate isomerase [Nocardia]|uniref:phosphoribosylanthranilate isomerase n=1 Tax=Nocardia abscessus TaxID=120957 RepID=UPI002B4AD3B0|nr:hypothetical protein [Nocardia abscessus]